MQLARQYSVEAVETLYQLMLVPKTYIDAQGAEVVETTPAGAASTTSASWNRSGPASRSAWLLPSALRS